MEEDELNNEQPESVEEEEVPQEKINQLKNLKYFRDWSDDAVREYVKERNKNRPAKGETPKLFSPEEPRSAEIEEEIQFDETEYKKTYDKYLKQYHKEYGVDMNDANDAQALQALVRYVIQAEYADLAVRRAQHGKNVDTRTLKNLGDFQRSLQTSITELQDRLGISRKTRKEKQVDDIPQYIRQLQLKAASFWKRQTIAVECDKCKIELARYWLNFPDQVEQVNFEITCEVCKEKVVYSG